MESKWLQVWISAENKNQMNKILNSLLSKKLVTGGQIVEAPARFLWKGEVSDMNYVSLTTWTTRKNKEEITSDVKQTTEEDVPMISFVSFEGNEEFTNWIDQTVK